MIQIYKPDNTDYARNGDITLLPSAATVHAILNSTWEASVSHPIDVEGRWKYIVEGTVVKMPSFNGMQLFRVKKKYKSDSGIEAEMEPIFYDSMDDCFLVDVRPTIKNGQGALDIMTAVNSKYSGQSDITTVATAYYVRKNLIEAINGDDPNSFVNRWGGEILYDNYTVIVNKRIGADYGIELQYGKNIPEDGLSEDIDIRDVVTRIYPTSYNGHTMSGVGYVDSPLIGNYPVVKTKTMKFENVKMREDASEEDSENGTVICDTQAELDDALEQCCVEQYALGLDKPQVTISADMVLLKNTDLYQDFAVLEEMSLGDTIHCRHSRLGIISDARIIELEYDSILKKVSSVVLGDFQGDYFDRVSSSVSRIDGVIDRNGNVMAERVAGILNGIQTQIRLQSTAAKKVDGRAFMVEDTDPDSPLYGCMIWGTQGLQISTRRTADGRDWDWTTAITAKGIVADAILTGIIADQTGTNYWNLDTGEFSLTSAAKIQTPDGEVSLSDYIKNQSEAARSLQVISSRDFIAVPTDAEGNNGNYQNAAVTIQVYYGDDDVSEQVTYSVLESGVTGTWNRTTATYTVSNLPGDEGTLQISVTYQGIITAKKVVQIAKIKAGESTPYKYMVLSTQTAKRGADGKIIPSSFTAQSFQQSSVTSAYPGIFRVEETIDGEQWTETYRSDAPETSMEYELSNIIVDEKGNYLVTDQGMRINAGGINKVSSVRIGLFDSEGKQLIDMQSVLIVAEAKELTPDDVFNLLTDGGRIQGLYRIGDQIYMNASYIRSGTYVVGGINDEHGKIDILDASGSLAGYINSTGAEFYNMQIGDCIIVYNSTRSQSASIGFEPGTETFYISGVPVTIPELHTISANITNAVISQATLNSLTISENINCQGMAWLNEVSVQGTTHVADLEAVGDITAVGDIVAGEQSLLNHKHSAIYNGSRSLVFDNTGSVQHIRTMHNGNALNGEVYLGSNASKFNSVYATNGTIQTSDEREKNIIGGFDERHLELLKKLQPMLFTWKNRDKKLHAGFGAQSLKKAMQECGIKSAEQFAVLEEEGVYSVAYSELIPLLTYGLLSLLNSEKG